MALTLMYITNDPAVALIAEKNGVDRIWVDLETLGKEQRQKGLNSVKSHHTIEDIRVISPLLTKAEMLVRVNPVNPESKKEIDEVIAAGADIIMLPMWKSPKEVLQFLKIVNGRVKTTLLLETKEAVDCVDDVFSLGGFDEIHIGLNDLHLSYGLSFMFELLSNGIVENLCSKFKQNGIPYGFGGIAKLGSGLIPAEMIIKEHYRLGSTRAILSRSFCNTDQIRDKAEIEKIFSINMQKFRAYEKEIEKCDCFDFDKNKAMMDEKIKIVSKEMV